MNPRGYCSCCGRGPVRITSQGWATACHRRWIKAGRPAAGPPAPLTGEALRQRLSEAARSRTGTKVRARQFRLRHFAQLRKDRPTASPAWYASRVGVDVRTIFRYQQDLEAAA